MGAIVDIGNVSALRTYRAHTNGWGHGMNLNMIALSIMMSPGVKSMTTALPANGTQGDTYIDPGTGKMCMWIDAWNDGDDQPAGWYCLSPNIGSITLVNDSQHLMVYELPGQWSLLVDLTATHNPVQRELAFYAPGLVRANTSIFAYVAGMELTFPAGADSSGAGLEIAPSAAITFNITGPGGTFGTIAFASGSLVGTVTIANETILQPAVPTENQYVQANVMKVISPADVKGASGLNVTLRGKIRGID
jgi:hypothetical protein